MVIFGLAYRAIPEWMGSSKPSLALIRLHFWLAVTGTLGVALNGTLGYEVLAMTMKPDFYYIGPAGQAVRNLWFGLDGLFLTVYGAGCVIFLYILMTRTTYTGAAAAQ